MTEHLTPPEAAVSVPAARVPLGVLLAWPETPSVGRQWAPARPSRFVDVLAAFHSANASAIGVTADMALLTTITTVVARTTVGKGIAYAAAVLGLGYVSRLYADRDSVQTRGFLWYPTLVALPLAAVAALLIVIKAAPVGKACTVAVAGLLALTAARALTWLLLVLARRRRVGLRPTLIVGNADLTTNVWRRLADFPEAGLAPAQLLSYEQAHLPGAIEREIDRWNIEHVVLVAPTADDTPLVAALPRHADRAPFFSAVPALAELFIDPHSITEVAGIPLIPLGRPTRTRQRFPGKRAFDAVVSAMLLLVTLPVLAAAALAIKLDDGGPVFFRQPRVGRGGETFQILKLRTMVPGADQMRAALLAHNVSDGLLFKLHRDPRVTRVGYFLRRTSIDELPQLFNVMRGEMSLVGPRPLAADPHEFTPAESERHTVLPGITGYWQLSGGNDLSYGEMIRLDLAYIRNWSLWLDLRLVLRTIPALIHRHGAP